MTRFLFPLILFVCGGIPSLPLIANSQVVERQHSKHNGLILVSDNHPAKGIRSLVTIRGTSIGLQSTFDLTNPLRLVDDYAQIMSLITSLHPTPWSVFNIGLGGSVLPRFHLSRYPSSFVDSVEIDRVMIVIATKYFRAEQAKHTIIEGDGVEVLKRQEKVYHVVWIDAFTPEGVPDVFLSEEFLSILQIKLNPKNLVVFNLSTENLKKLRETVKRYKSRYSHGITVNLPEAKNQIIIAVGSILTLTCSNFFSAYKNWVKQNLATVRWSTKSINPITEICTDLH